MLIAFTALVALLNAVLGWTVDCFASLDGRAAWGLLHGHAMRFRHVEGVSLENLLGYLCSPVAWLCGIPWHECHKVGSLLGVKTILNEFIAYKQ